MDRERVSEDFKEILDITYKYCKYIYDDDDVAKAAQQINAKAYQVVKLLKLKSGSETPLHGSLKKGR